MTKLPLLACTFIMSTILSPIGAIDVNIPGADSKIPKDAYVNYQATNPDIEKDVANYVKTLKATDKAKGISKKEIEYAKAASTYRGQHYHNTVISVHDQYNQIRLSFPVAGIKSDYHIGRYQNPSRTIEDYRVLTNNGSLNLEIDYADFKDYDWRNTKTAYEKLTDKDVRNFLQDNAKRKSSKQISDIKGTVFSYPTVTYSTWDSMKMPHFENGKKATLTIDTINFKFKGYNMRHPLYHAGFVYYDNNPVLNKVPTDKLLANYVLPSVQNLNELNQYSRIESLNGVQYRVPKDAIYEGESKASEHQDVRYYKKGDITFFVSTDNIPKNPYAHELVINGHYNFKAGAAGVISVIGNALPKAFSRMIRLEFRGEYEPARKIHHSFTELYSLLFVDGNPAGVKALLNDMGFIENELRLPLVPTRIATKQKMSDILKTLNI